MWLQIGFYQIDFLNLKYFCVGYWCTCPQISMILGEPFTLQRTRECKNPWSTPTPNRVHLFTSVATFSENCILKIVSGAAHRLIWHFRFQCFWSICLIYCSERRQVADTCPRFIVVWKTFHYRPYLLFPIPLCASVLSFIFSISFYSKSTFCIVWATIREYKSFSTFT